MEVEMETDEHTTPLIEAVPESMEAESPPAIQETTAMAIVPDKEDDEWSGSYTWRIDNFSKSMDRRHSENFEVATYYWRLLVFPSGQKTKDWLSVYLDAPEAPMTPQHMSPCAKFVLHLINQINPQKRISKEATHKFSPSECDWGFTNFFAVDELMNPKNGWIVNDTVVLKVDVRVEPDEKYNLDARKESGFVGLKNQGATCYMNSLLQYMYNLPFLRTAVYHMPTSENDEASKSLPLALQGLFYKLQYSKTHVSTKDLTKSFGWGTYDAFMQHDVQELNRVLCEKLEEKMKGTKVERVITELFEGHTYNYIECINVDYKSSRKESFMDLQLDVKNCRDVYASFERYCEVETMDGANQYKAEGHGLQDARKGVLFGNLPPVLQLQLKRFEYDFHRDTMVKINDRYEFPEELDLDFGNHKIFAPEADKSVRNLYHLHSVLVHSGGVHGGHYYAFIRPDGHKWIKFDDDRVEVSDTRRAMEEQFGGDDESVAPVSGFTAPHPPLRFTKHSNAYMLVYVRASDWPRIMCENAQEDIAEYLRERLQQEQQEKEARQKMKKEAHLYCTLKLATDRDLVEQVGSSSQHYDLVNHDRLPPEQVFRIKKNVRFSQFKLLVADQLGVPVEAQRYWIWAPRGGSGALRPSRPLTPEEEEKAVMELREYRDQRACSTKQSLMDIKLLLEVPVAWNKDTQRQVPALSKALRDHKDGILLFFKYYDPRAEAGAEVRYVGRLMPNKSTMLRELQRHMCAFCGLPDMTDLEVYEESMQDPTLMLTLADPNMVLGSQLENGDILVIQRKLSPEEAAECRFPGADRFLDYIRRRRLVTFKKLEEPKEEGLQLELLKDMDYTAVTQVLAERLELPHPEHLRLTQHNGFSHQPQKAPLKHSTGLKLEQMLQHAQHVNEVLYYEVLDMPLDELEKLKIIKLLFFNEKTELVGEHVVRLPRDGTVADLLDQLKGKLGPGFETKPLRLMEISNGKVYKVYRMDEAVEAMNDMYWQLRAEVVPEEELQASADAGEDPGERLIHVVHFHQGKDNMSPITFGDPFLLRIQDNEPMSSIRSRIQAKLGVASEEFSKWRFAYVPDKYHAPEYLEDDDILGLRYAKAQGSQGLDTNHCLGLHHEDKAPRRPATNRLTYEKPVKIYS